MTPKRILCVLAAICFALDAFSDLLKLKRPIAWTPAGFCLLTIALTLI
jgi:hypothetical protein